jgi:HNH endonuclease
VSGEPYSKSRQLARGVRRYRRIVASPKQWQAIESAKRGPCRVCTARPVNEPIALHHLVRRGDGGDDVADNIVPVCFPCHFSLHNRAPAIGRLLLTRLSDAEYAYMVERGGEDYAERAYGITYQRGGAT